MAKRIQFHTHGGIEHLDYVDFIPSDPMAGEVQIQHKAIGINYIDTYIRSGLYPVTQFPSGLGSEAAGIVTKVGSGVTMFNVGSRVVYAQGPLGAYSTEHNVPAEKVVLLPEEISFEQGAAALLKGITVYYLLQKTYQVQENEIFLFHAAAGGVGLIACQWAKVLGAKLIGTVGSDEKAAYAKQAGAWATINYQKESIPQRVSTLTQGEKVKVVYDSVGQHTWLASLDSLKKRGLLVSFGNSSGAVTGVDLRILNQKGSLFVTRPSLNGYIDTYQALQTASQALFTLMISGAIDIKLPPSQLFPLAEAARAHQVLQRRATIGSSLLIPE